MDLGTSVVPFCCSKPRVFLESCWSLVNDGNLETLVLVSAKESAAAATGQTQSKTRGKTRQAKDEQSSSSHTSLYLGCYQKALLTFEVDLAILGKAIRTVPQLRFPSQVILTWGKLTLKPLWLSFLHWLLSLSKMLLGFSLSYHSWSTRFFFMVE